MMAWPTGQKTSFFPSWITCEFLQIFRSFCSAKTFKLGKFCSTDLPGDFVRETAGRLPFLSHAGWRPAVRVPSQLHAGGQQDPCGTAER